MHKLKHQILLVEDESFAKELVRHCLSTQYDVVTRENGEEALKYLYYKDPPALILTDIDMPIMDGFSLLMQLKKHIDFQHIPVVILSSRHEEKEMKRGLHYGAEDYLIKPFKPEQLIDSLHRIIETHYN
jgi:PleD family two-component response regulator